MIEVNMVHVQGSGRVTIMPEAIFALSEVLQADGSPSGDTIVYMDGGTQLFVEETYDNMRSAVARTLGYDLPDDEPADDKDFLGLDANWPLKHG